MSSFDEPQAVPARFAVDSIGQRARHALADGAEGRVLAVFRRSFYAEMEAGQLACIGPLSLGDGPLNARSDLPEQIDLEEAGIRPGEPARIAGSDLVVSRSFALSLAGARIWRAPEPSGEVDPDRLREGLDRFHEAVRASTRDIGLARLAIGPKPQSSAAILDHAALAISALTAWMAVLLQDKDAAPPEEADLLIGLGPGLTPAGDDWIGGAMIALRSFGHAEAARRIAQWALPLAQTRTGKISIAHLAAAAAGEGSAALHDAINAICGADSDTLNAALANIDAIGHTSGWDALAGAVAALSSRCAWRC